MFDGQPLLLFFLFLFIITCGHRIMHVLVNVFLNNYHQEWSFRHIKLVQPRHFLLKCLHQSRKVSGNVIVSQLVCIDFVSFYNIEFWKRSNSMLFLFFIFHFFDLLLCRWRPVEQCCGLQEIMTQSEIFMSYTCHNKFKYKFSQNYQYIVVLFKFNILFDDFQLT